MATVNSTQYANTASVPPTLNKPNELGGRVRVAYFSYVVGTAGLGNGDIVNLTLLPTGSRVIGGRLTWDALGTSVTVKVGYSGSDAKYLSATSAASAGGTDIANLTTLGFGDEYSATSSNTIGQGRTIFLTTGGAATSSTTSTTTISGVIKYVVD